MKFIKPSFEILTDIDGEQVLKNLERACRTAYKSEDMIKEKSAHRLIKKIVHEFKHESVIEHESISVRIICDRGVSHEIVRHRLASYTQESTRYCNYTTGKFGNSITYIIPPWFSDTIYEGLSSGVIRSVMDVSSSKGQIWADAPDISQAIYWISACHQAEVNYQNLITDGWTPQEARGVLPNSLKTELVMTANLREWRHIFKVRTDKAAHPQMREIMIPMLAEFKKIIPIIFEEI